MPRLVLGNNEQWKLRPDALLFGTRAAAAPARAEALAAKMGAETGARARGAVGRRGRKPAARRRRVMTCAACARAPEPSRAAARRRPPKKKKKKEEAQGEAADEI